MKVLNLDTGKIEDRDDPWEKQRDKLEVSKAFFVDGIRYAGYCDICKNPVHWDDRAIHINKICGNTRVEVSHRRCL